MKDLRIYSQNLGILNESQQRQLMATSVLIVGLGGLGGHMANQLCRLGVSTLFLVDYDSFTPSNLNRQLFSSTENIGHAKIDVVQSELLAIRPDLHLHTFKEKIQDIDVTLIQDIDYIVDCTDNLSSKLYITHLGSTLHKPVLHGACAGWYGQLGWILPGCDLLKDLYQDREKGLEEDLKNPTFAPAVVASYMTAEYVKMVIGNHPTVNRILFLDVLNNTIHASQEEE